MATNTLTARCLPMAPSLQHQGRPLLSPLQMLLQMGFSQTRAEKALSATGDRSVQLASDWLAARLNDPKLDEVAPREYVLYMRPSGPLSMQIYNFWNDVLETVGRNAAQNLMPHITLCSYFKVPDEHSWRLSEMLLSAVHTVMSSQTLPLPLPLEKYTSQNYMGLFVTSPAAPVLQSIRKHFIQAASTVCPSLSSNTTADEDLHLTLAYGYSPTQYPVLEELVQRVDMAAPATWELCLYSRESRFNGLELYRSVRGYTPLHTDELPLLCGDYVYVHGDEAAAVGEEGSDGWVHGTSWLTGCKGLLPRQSFVRVPDSDTWTLHRGVTITQDGHGIEITDGAPVEDTAASADGGAECESSASRGSGLSLSLLNLLDHSEGSRRSTTAHADSILEHSVEGGAAQRQHLEYLYSKVNKSCKAPRKPPPPPPLYTFPIPGPRKVFVLRHGERADFTFGDWCKPSFSEDGKYSRADLNLPPVLPSRVDIPHSWSKDCPLTRVGELQARLVGEGFVATNTPVHHVFVSPSLRCIMTASFALRSMDLADRLPLCIEPGLLEWLAWYPDGIPRYMTPEELTAAGYNVDATYRPVMGVSQLCLDESCEQYYHRSNHVTSALLAATQAQRGSVLLVAHAATLDTCLRQLVGGHPRNSADMTSLVKKVPYCALQAAEEGPGESGWNLVEPPFRSPTHAINHAYDWTIWRQ